MSEIWFDPVSFMQHLLMDILCGDETCVHGCAAALDTRPGDEVADGVVSGILALVDKAETGEVLVFACDSRAEMTYRSLILTRFSLSRTD